MGGGGGGHDLCLKISEGKDEKSRMSRKKKPV